MIALLIFIAFKMVYGGKVLDKFDRRILFAYMDEYLGDFLFDSFQPFHFCQQTNYTIPYAAHFLGKLRVTIKSLSVWIRFRVSLSVGWSVAWWVGRLVGDKNVQNSFRTNTRTKLKCNFPMNIERLCSMSLFFYCSKFTKMV